MSSSEWSSTRKRVGSPSGLEICHEHFKRESCEEKNDHRTREESPIREQSVRHTPESRYISREEISNNKYGKRSISPARKESLGHHSSSRREQSPNRGNILSCSREGSRSPKEIRSLQLRDKDLSSTRKISECRSPKSKKCKESPSRGTSSKNSHDRSNKTMEERSQKYRDTSPGRTASSCHTPKKKRCLDFPTRGIERDRSAITDISSSKRLDGSDRNSSRHVSDTKHVKERGFHTIRRKSSSNSPESCHVNKLKIGILNNDKNNYKHLGTPSPLYDDISNDSFEKEIPEGSDDMKERPSIKNSIETEHIVSPKKRHREKYLDERCEVSRLDNELKSLQSSTNTDACRRPHSEEVFEGRRPSGVLEESHTKHRNKCKDSSNDINIHHQNLSAGETVVTLEKNCNATLGYLEKEKEIEKQVSNCENSAGSGSQSNCINVEDTNGDGEEEISEESRLIQLNPALREFDILDDLDESDHEDGEAQQSNSSEYDTDFDESLPVEDVDAMLEEGLPDKFKDPGKNKEHVIKLKRKVVLEEIGYDHFDLLPEGWIQIMHSSGMPVYLHQKSRVCTMARPYYLGPGSSRNHKVPLSAIPCLQYRRALETEKKNKEEKEKNLEQKENQSEIQLMAAKIETSEENEAAQSLEALDLREYCKKVFSFKTITLIPFKSWADRRKYVRMTKDLKKRQRPSLPGGTKLLKFPIQNPDGTNSRSKGEWIINPNGKSYVCILHEYVQHALKKHPKYQFKELENPATPYSATVFIGEMQYSVGMGASKKQAKVEAAKAALEVLIPEMKEKIERDCQFGMRSGIARRPQISDISIFDQIRVEDPRVAEFCAKTTEPPPYAILLTCLSRNMGLGDIKVQYQMNSKKHKEDEFTMVVGNHTATVVCKNKRDGKQRAAQAILQMLHPNITHWGSLLRMYGNRSIKNVKEKKQEEQEITGLQSKASINQPNFAILAKLRTEMLKLKDKREAIKAKGKFIPPENIILPSLSSTDLNKVNFL